METIPTPPNPFIDDFGQLVIPSFGEWFFLPGDWVIYLLTSRVPAVAELLELSVGDYGGTLAGFLAWVCWVAFAIASIAASAAVRRFDRAVTQRLAELVAELRRHARMAIVLARYRRERHTERKEPSIDVGELPGLRPDELRILRLHAKLAPGFALAVSDVADELGARSHEVRAALERLQKLALLQATVGGLDGETAYTLTAAGRALLQMRHARPRTA
jgi:DNA-binding MarR family transcriptional regulator